MVGVGRSLVRCAASLLVIGSVAASTLAAPVEARSAVAAVDDGPPTRIEFASGSDNTTVTGSVTTSVDRYVLRAEGGQHLVMSVSSAGAVVVFTLRAPSAAAVSPEGVRTWQGQLPESGDYSLEVASTVGPADYTMPIRITWDAPATGTTSSERVSFAPGTSGTTVAGDLAAGDVDNYVLGAAAGQLMTVSVSSAGGATFGVSGPGGVELAGAGQTSWSGTLPADGDYTVSVTAAAATGYEVSFSIVSAAGAPPTTASPTTGAPAPPPSSGGVTTLGPPPEGAAMANPLVLTGDGTTYVSDGRHAVALPGTGGAIAYESGTVVLTGSSDAPDGVLYRVAHDGEIVKAPCRNCAGLAVYDGRMFTARDPRTSPEGFEIVALDLTSLDQSDIIAATRVVSTGEYNDEGREYWDVPTVVAADANGLVVVYDYEPGGTNARGGGQVVIARYAYTGELVEHVVVSIGRIEGPAVLSPDGRFAAIPTGGSSGACYTHGGVAVVELTSLTVTASPMGDYAPDGSQTWFIVSPFWDSSLLHGFGQRYADGPLALGEDCSPEVARWDMTFDSAAGSWSEGAPSEGLVRWVGPSCSDLLTLAGQDELWSSTYTVTGTLDGVPADLGTFGAVALGSGRPAECT